MRTATLPFGGCGHSYLPSSSFKIGMVMDKSNNDDSQSSSSPKDSEPTTPVITSNVKQNLEYLRLQKEFRKRKSNTPRPSISYCRKKVEKEDLPEDTELYRDPTTTLYYTNQGIDNALPVLLVDGYNVCGYWPKLKKHFMKGRLDVACQKLLEELVEFKPHLIISEIFTEVRLVVALEAMLSGMLHTRKSLLALREDGYPKVWVVTSDHCQQHAAYGAIKASRKEVERTFQEQRSHSFQGRLLKHNLDSEVVDALKNLRNKLSENESKLVTVEIGQIVSVTNGYRNALLKMYRTFYRTNSVVKSISSATTLE